MRCDNLKFSDEITQVVGKYEYKNDVAVLLIFFNRPSKIAKVFEQVKKARPSRLYLYQDGARMDRKDDIKAIESCRRVVDDIDWSCTVHRLYQKENFGCDPSEYIAQKWMFETEEMGIVLEDDDVPSQSFFPYCVELLERYRYDKRIAIICGMNNYDVEESIEESYFFSKRGSIWGWASWKRFIDLWDSQYAWLDDRESRRAIQEYCDKDMEIKYETWINVANGHRNTGREHYESIMFAAAASNDMLNIVPKYNMISNIGVDNESTHSVADIRLLNRRTQKLLYKKVYEIDIPLKHPKEIVRNRNYDRKYKISKAKKAWERMETGIRKILFKGIFR